MRGMVRSLAVADRRLPADLELTVLDEEGKSVFLFDPRKSDLGVHKWDHHAPEKFAQEMAGHVAESE